LKEKSEKKKKGKKKKLIIINCELSVKPPSWAAFIVSTRQENTSTKKRDLLTPRP